MLTPNGPLSPGITIMIRLDHSYVFLAYRRYRIETAWWRKRAIVRSVRTALEIHAQRSRSLLMTSRICSCSGRLFVSASLSGATRAMAG